MSPNRHALVYGASGLAGWGLVNQLLSNYPDPGSFAKVTALVNRPLNLDESYWPISEHPKFRLVSGVDLSREGRTEEEFGGWLKNHVDDIDGVTHIFYFPYSTQPTMQLEVAVNSRMFALAIGAVDLIAPSLEMVIYPGGSRRYGAYFPNCPFKPPFREDMGRLDDIEATGIFYYAFEDWLEARKKKKRRTWDWVQSVPDAIIGFSPFGSTFNLTGHFALYLSTYALVEGHGATCPFPGSMAGYTALNNDGSADMIAKFSIWAAFNRAKVCKDEGEGSRIFNIADQDRPVSMQERWPQICKYFGLVGTAPEEESEDGAERLRPSKYVMKHMEALDKAGIKGVDVWKTEFLDELGYNLDMDRDFDMTKLRRVGFTDQVDPGKSWTQAFDLFRSAGMIV